MDQCPANAIRDATDRQPSSRDAFTSSRDAFTPRRRRWFRLLAALLPFVVWALVEGWCRLVGWGRPPNLLDIDPALQGGPSLFVLDSTGQRYVTRPSRLKFFVKDSFPAAKPEGAFRIFCLGGSTVQGRPYGKETAFSTWLQLSLQAAEPSRQWEVINCGGVSYGSERLVPILREVLDYQPDLIIVCTGHNEFLEEHTYGSLKRAPHWMFEAARLAPRLHTVQLLRQGVDRLTGRPPAQPDSSQQEAWRDVDAFLDYRGGLRAYWRDAEWWQAVFDQFELNLRRMVRLAREARVPLWLMRPPSNLRDCPPFKSQHRDGLGVAELERWRRLTEQAASVMAHDPARAAELYRQAIAVDDQYAASFYALGKCYEAMALPRPAKAAFLQARELDVCPLRILQRLEAILRNVATETHTPLLDAHRWLEERSQWEILGDDWLLDHVHPSIRGHQLIAEQLFHRIQAVGWVKPVAGWTATQRRLYAQHFDRLDALYFMRGRQRLDNLRAWTQGRAAGPPLEARRTGSAKPSSRSSAK